MHVIMRHHISGARDGQPWPARGEGIDLPDAEAASLVASGHAIQADSPVETSAARVEVETATTGLTKAAASKAS